MSLRSNKGFSLIEVLVTVSVLSVAVVFIFRAFTASLAAADFNKNMTLGCLLAEERLWDAEFRSNSFSVTNGEATLGAKNFNWELKLDDTDSPDLKQALLTVAWQQGRENLYSMDFLTYYLSQ